MKYLKTFENFTIEDIELMLQRAKNRSLIDKNVNIDNIIKNLKEKPKIGTFEDFVDNEASFISAGDQQRMGEYIKKFKELGLNTKKAEYLYPKLERYLKIQNEIDDLHVNYDTEIEPSKKIDNLYDEEEKLRPYIDDLESEIKKLAKKAKIILNK